MDLRPEIFFCFWMVHLISPQLCRYPGFLLPEKTVKDPVGTLTFKEVVSCRVEGIDKNKTELSLELPFQGIVVDNKNRTLSCLFDTHSCATKQFEKYLPQGSFSINCDGINVTFEVNKYENEELEKFKIKSNKYLVREFKKETSLGRVAMFYNLTETLQYAFFESNKTNNEGFFQKVTNDSLDTIHGQASDHCSIPKELAFYRMWLDCKSHILSPAVEKKFHYLAEQFFIWGFILLVIKLFIIGIVVNYFTLKKLQHFRGTSKKQFWCCFSHALTLSAVFDCFSKRSGEMDHQLEMLVKKVGDNHGGEVFMDLSPNYYSLSNCKVYDYARMSGYLNPIEIQFGKCK